MIILKGYIQAEKFMKRCDFYWHWRNTERKNIEALFFINFKSDIGNYISICVWIRISGSIYYCIFDKRLLVTFYWSDSTSYLSKRMNVWSQVPGYLMKKQIFIWDDNLTCFVLFTTKKSLHFVILKFYALFFLLKSDSWFYSKRLKGRKNLL